MKQRSSSELPFKRFPSTDSIKLKPMKSYRPTTHLKQQASPLHKNLLINHNSKTITAINKSIEKYSESISKYDMNKEAEEHYPLRKGGSMKNIHKIGSGRPITSKKGEKRLFPKLQSSKKRGGDDGILILSELPHDYLIKKEERLKIKSTNLNQNVSSLIQNNNHKSMRNIEMHMQTQQGNTEQKKKKFRLKNNLTEELLAQLKKSFKLRIINGVVETKTSEIINLKRTKSKQIDKIDKALLLLNKFTAKYHLKGNYQLQYNTFQDLFLNPKPSNRVIINSLILNQEQIPQQLVRIPGSQYLQQNGVNKAALKIQSIFKMWQQKKPYSQYQQYISKIKHIQQYWKRKILMINFKKEMKKRKLEKLQQFKMIQQEFKQKWYLTKNKKRWEIHIPNIGTSQFSKLTTEKLIQQQCSQLLRVFKIAHNFLINIVFISPNPLNQDILNYYYKIFQINNMMEYINRLRFVHPQNFSKFSSTISISRVLIQSPIAISKIKAIIQDSPAYIVAGQNSNNSDIHLSLELNLPIFGTPLKTQYLSINSNLIDLLKQCYIPSTLVAKDIYNQTELINTLSVLIFNNIEVRKWIIKIDGEYDNRGSAVLNILSFPMVKMLLKSFQEIRSYNQAYVLENDIIKALTDELREQYHQKIKIMNKKVYRSNKEYFKELIKKGVVIQKGIEGNEIHISFIIYPDEEMEVIHAMQAIKSGQRIIAVMSPIEANTYKQCSYTVKALAKQLTSKGMFGHFTIQLIHQVEEERYYCSGLKPYLDSLSSYNYFAGFINSMSIPDQTNQSEKCTICCPFLLHSGMSNQTIKSFFQKSRYSNIEFDMKIKEGVLFLPQNTLQSECLGVMAIGSSYYAALARLVEGFQFLIKQFREGKQDKQKQKFKLKGSDREKYKRNEMKMSVVAAKSKIKGLMAQMKREVRPQPSNLQWLF